MQKIKFFCLPYAGGSAAIYKRWEKYLHNSIEVCPLELPGRGSRHNIPLKYSMEDVVEDIFKLFCEEIGSSDYAFFGHSMGSVIALELTGKIINSGLKKPSHIFFSGRYPPHVIKQKYARHQCSDQELIEEALCLGGITEKFLRYKALLDQFIRTLRADYQIIDTYQYTNKIEKLNFDISILCGNRDPVFLKEEMDLWDVYSTKKCNKFEFDGGHFFIHDNIENITEIINNTLVKNEIKLEKVYENCRK